MGASKSCSKTILWHTPPILAEMGDISMLLGNLEPSSYIDARELRALVETGAVVSAMLVALPEGSYVLQVSTGENELVLAAKRGHPRRYSAIETAAMQLRALGIQQVALDLSALQVDRMTQMSRGVQRRLAL